MTLASCSSDSCFQDDWVGTFNKDREWCDNGESPLFEDSVTFFPGSCTNCVTTEGSKDLIFDSRCFFTIETPLFGDLIYTLNGNSLRVTAPLIKCTATYSKQ